MVALTVRTTRDQFERYARLVKACGIEQLKGLVPLHETPERVRILVEIDPHLNNIPLHHWHASFGGYCILVRLAMADRRIERDFNLLSLDECVCILKHVAVYHVACATPSFGES